MSSLAFSVGNFSPRKLNTLVIKNVNTTGVSFIEFSSNHKESWSLPQLQLNEKPTLLRRREAVGLSFCFGFLDVLLQQQSAAAIEAAPCQLTVAPSGLAFCDKVVGTGPEATKGQLIKVMISILLSSCIMVIKGWDQGILGGDGVPPMLAGGKRILKLPPELGYGMRGAGCRGGSCIIPPDSVLLFDVEFIGKAFLLMNDKTTENFCYPFVVNCH
ncbi:hypothetical protein SLEP1_g52758 [Rubroshorea leprosula]|uniref:peptidylprolyl isomerase n=1 Tax=Rubroshorea leprosula TaxID=152421 RepID=A0AAV5M9Z6_9ROSI|nr:hypothetical protein SLEP1_g52758 [Rubroshorea leprosula]